jgi:NitT/TauT family transport system ATP-binding protein
MKDYIMLDSVGFDYRSERGRILALQGVGMTIGRGDAVAIVGPSGCGKSTLLKLIAGLLRPTAGEVKVGGDEVRTPLTNVGMAFQNPLLLPWRTVVDNVLLPFELLPGGYGSRQAQALRARELLQKVGLSGFERKYPWELSGGMQQRVSLCRALVHNPEILLLDEPFGALDAFTRETLWVATQDLWGTRNCTLVLVTHDIREAVFLSNTVFVMSPRPGRIVHSEHVDFPRPRALVDCYAERFGEIFRSIRSNVGGEEVVKL